ncbi:hypothetical protein QUF75_10620 [Desulfococcaceae bacterium HSG7]|nr:hypothetical protein [Desulfococcaceae bacterium HSG7]
MELHNCLQKLLKTSYLSEVSDKTIVLKGGQEPDDAYSVELTEIKAKNISVINLGVNPHSSLISKEGGFNRICDYMILIPRQNNKIVAMLCELKKTYQSKARDQLHASAPFLDYIQSLLLTHFDEKRQFICKFVIIASKNAARIDKQTTRPNPITSETITNEIITNETIIFKNIEITLIIGETIPFNKILS